MKIFIIAGEDSGDKLGAAIMDGLKKFLIFLQFLKVWVVPVWALGLSSIFPMSELAVMGFTEILYNYTNLKKRLNQTVSAILDEKPDILLTIDSPEFCFRVAKKTKALNRNIPIVHYVTVCLGSDQSGQKQFLILLIMF